MLDIDGLTFDGLLSGVTENEKEYCCAVCGERFRKGEIFPDQGRLFEASLAAERHVQRVHGGMLEVLLSEEGKHAPFTDNQKLLLRLIAAQKTDAEIAAETGTTLSTVRHQKFVFREKLRQAKVVQAVCTLALSGKTAEQDEILPPHGGAKMVDDRYLITAEERAKIIKGAFSSMDPLVLRAIPPKEKKKVVVLGCIAEKLEPGRRYTERELNEFLRSVHPDFVTLRRYLIEYGFMDRERDCSAYWKRG